MKKNRAPGWMYLLLVIFALCPPLMVIFAIIIMLSD